MMGIVKDQQKNKNKAVDFLLSLTENSEFGQKTLNNEQFWTAK